MSVTKLMGTKYELGPSFAVSAQGRIRLTDAVSVKDFGAVGDGVADDTAAIQAAIDNGSKSVHFPAGTYRITATIVVSGSIALTGAGAGVTTLSQRTANIDSVQFAPTTAGVTAAFLNSAAIRGISVDHSPVAATATSGAGVRFVQCNGYKLFDVTVNDAAEGITIQGGQLGSLKSFQVYASSGPAQGTDTALLAFRQAPYGASFQPCYTVEVEDFRMSASKLRDTCILIRNGDGLQFANGYVAFGLNSLVKIKAERDNSYVSATTFTNVYLDCVGPTHTLYGVHIPDDGFANTFVYQCQVGGGCVIGNGQSVGVLVRKANTGLLSLEGAAILNMEKWAVDVEGSTSMTDLQIANCQISNCGDATSGAVRASTGRSLSIVGNTFAAPETVAVALAGTWVTGTIAANVNASTTADLSNSATFTNALVMAGNSSRDTAASSSWRGVRPGNFAASNANTLDWYEEGAFTPTVSFGGNSVGLTYSAQSGRFTRIGNVVHFSLSVTLSAKGSSTGDVAVGGLPYTSSSAHSVPVTTRVNNMANNVGDGYVQSVIFASGTSIAPYKIDVSGSTEFHVRLTDADMTATSVLTFAGTYEVA